MLDVLIESALRSLVVGIGVWMLLRLLRIRNPHVIALAWKAVLITALFMPLLMQWTMVTVPIAGASLSELVSNGAAPAAAHSIQWSTALLWCYLTIAGVLLLRYVSTFAAGWRIFRQSRRIEDPSREGLSMRVSSMIRTPATFGSTILVPDDFMEWDAARQRAVILHERTHVKNRDFYFQAAAHAHRIVFWFSPFSWWLPGQLGRFAEELSDDAVVAEALDRGTYADILLQIAGRHHHTPVALAMAEPANVVQRVDRILNEQQCLPRPGFLRRAGTLLALIPIVIIAAGIGNAAISAAEAPAKAPHVRHPPSVDPQAHLTEPDYPPESRAKREEGTVTMALYVLVNGSVADAKLLESSGYTKLDEAALNHAKTWQFKPAQENGKAIAMWYPFKVTFALTDAERQSGKQQEQPTP